MQMKDMLAPDPIHLPEDPAQKAVASDRLEDVAVAHPESPLVWALLAERALDDASVDDATPSAFIVAYALARTGYHRGLDRLRGNGWKGWGPVPFDHEPNQGVLRAIAVLARAASAIGEDTEYDRLSQMLADADPNTPGKLLY